MSTVQPHQVLSIGECMVELARGDDGRFGLSFGGDTFNTAVYLSRLGIATAYATALGDDPYSDGIVALTEAEGIASDLIVRVPGRMPGLYLIETSAGERTFWYWRERSPARELFELALDGRLQSALRCASAIYFSGITMSLYSDRGRELLAAGLAEAKAAGARIVMDSNYRPRGWPDGLSAARSVFARFWAMADIALPTFDDEAALWGDASPAVTVTRLRELGVGEIVVKLGADGAAVAVDDAEPLAVPCPACITPVDTTAAGDAFNAGYLAARLGGATPPAAALAGHRLAGLVVQHRGAIIPRPAMAGLDQH